MKSEMTDMADHNAAFESIIHDSRSITTTKEDSLKFYACAFVKPGMRLCLCEFFLKQSSVFKFLLFNRHSI